MTLVTIQKDYFQNERGDWVSKSSEGLDFNKTFFRKCKITKSKTDFDCNICGKKFPKGTRYICLDGWAFVCYCCAENVLTKSKENFENVLKLFEEIKQEILVNKNKWDNELVINSI